MSYFDERFQLPAALAFASLMALGAILVSDEAIADITLDDFVDSARIQSPVMENVRVATLSVGQLNAEREVEIASAGTAPMGRFDISQNSPGWMSVQIDNISRTDMLTPLTAVPLRYEFQPSNVTQGVRNDAILFDFVELLGSIQPSYLRAIVWDNTDVTESYEIRLFPLQEFTERKTLVAPFRGFTQRGGSPGTPDPTTLKRIHFDFYFLGHFGELNWSARLDQIRFGSSLVPEPATSSFVWACVWWTGVLSRFRWWACSWPKVVGR